jgi:hypothetical protein
VPTTSVTTDTASAGAPMAIREIRLAAAGFVLTVAFIVALHIVMS